jgi:transcriptional regulator with XRE-family HTH domain
MKEGIELYCAQRLRELRKERGLTLQECEALSGGELKAVVLGSYERGTRSISLARIEQLASFFNVPMQYFLGTQMSPPSARRWIIDIRRVREQVSQRAEIEKLLNFIFEIAGERSDWRGEILTVRASDARALKVLLANSDFNPEEELLTRKILIERN